MRARAAGARAELQAEAATEPGSERKAGLPGWRGRWRGAGLLPVGLLLLWFGGCGGGEPPAGEEAEFQAGAPEAPDPAGAGAQGPGLPPGQGAESREAPAAGAPGTPPPGIGAPGAPEEVSGPHETLEGTIRIVGTAPVFHLGLQVATRQEGAGQQGTGQQGTGQQGTGHQGTGEEGALVTLGRLDGVLDPEADPAHPLAELARLEGAEVQLRGRTPSGAGPPRFGVTGYTLLRVEGGPAWAGRLERGGSAGGEGAPSPQGAAGGGRAGTDPPGPRLHLDRDEGAARSAPVLVGLPSAGPPDGARIWVVGSLRGDTIHVEGFGVLRLPEAP